MKAILVLGLVSLVVTFLIGLLGAFPLNGAADDATIQATGVENTSRLDIAAIKEVGERFSFAYHSVVDDIASFQQNPSVEQAEARRQAFVGYAQLASQRYQDFAETLQDRLDELTIQSNDGSSP